jgi:exosortase/archaeosortase family protein
MSTYFSNLKKIKELKFSKEEISFLIRSLAMLIVWLILNQWSLIDKYIMYSMKAQTLWILNFIGNQGFEASSIHTTDIDARFFIVCPNVLFKISKGCAGKSLLFLYTAFILIFPQSNPRRKLIFLIMGLFLIHEYNVIRIVALSLSLKHLPDWYDFLHVYFFQTLIYLLLFLLIRRYFNPLKQNVSKTI